MLSLGWAYYRGMLGCHNRATIVPKSSQRKLSTIPLQGVGRFHYRGCPPWQSVLPILALGQTLVGSTFSCSMLGFSLAVGNPVKAGKTWSKPGWDEGDKPGNGRPGEDGNKILVGWPAKSWWTEVQKFHYRGCRNSRLNRVAGFPHRGVSISTTGGAHLRRVIRPPGCAHAPGNGPGFGRERGRKFRGNHRGDEQPESGHEWP